MLKVFLAEKITGGLNPGLTPTVFRLLTLDPAIDAREWRRASAVYRRLPELKRRIEELEAKLAQVAPKDAK